MNKLTRNNLKNTLASQYLKNHIGQNHYFHNSLFQMGLHKGSVPNYTKGSIFTYESHTYFSLISKMIEVCANKGIDNFNILEIGTGTGYFSLTLALLSKYIETTPSNSVKLKITSIDNNIDRISAAESLLKTNNLSDKIEFKNTNSIDFFKTNKQIFNFILIDGSHEYEIFKIDLDNCLKSIPAENIPFYIACDDAYETPQNFKGIYDAIVENKNLIKKIDNCLFLLDEYFDMHNYQDDLYESNRLEKKWLEKNYRCWDKNASTKSTSFGYTNIHIVGQ